jgi:DNA-binding response OmpR family regulator
MCDFHVITAANGKEGLEKAVNMHPDLILLDTMMPVMDGHQMLEQLREHPKGRNISVIMVTACGLIDDIDKADSFNVDAYVIKPFSAHDLIAKMRDILERKGILVPA